MLKFFDRYVLKEVVPPFFLGLLIYSFVLLMNQLLQLSEMFIARGVSLGATLKLLLYLVPAILAFSVPMSVLMGILAGLSRMSTDSEVTAVKTLGISPARMLRPLLLFAFAGWALTSILTLDLAPCFNFKWIQTLTDSVLNAERPEFKPREFNESVSNMVLYFHDAGKDNAWRKVFLYFSDPPDQPRIVLAGQGRLDVYPQSKRAVLDLRDVLQHSGTVSDPEKEDYRVTTASQIAEEIDAASLFPSFTAEKRMREKNIVELYSGLRALRVETALLERDRRDVERRRLGPQHPQRLQNEQARGQARGNRRGYLVEIHKKFALPFACLIFVFLGMPLGSSTKKGGRTSGFTISIVIILVYYICITAGEKTAMDGRISPFIGMWGGNILLGLFSIWLYVQSARETRVLSRLGRPSLKEGSGIRKLVRRLRWPRLSVPFPNILDRYLIRRYLSISALIFVSLISVSIIVTFFDRIGSLYEHKKSLSMLWAYIRYRIPEFTHFSLPVTALMATLLTLGLFTKFNELTAMKACGISIYRAVLPLAFLAVLVGGLAYHIQENVLPYSNKKAEDLWNKINDRPAQSYSYQNRRWVADKSGARFYHYNYFDPKTSTFSQLSIFDLDVSRWTIVRRYYAEKAVLNDQTLQLVSGWVREFSGRLQTEFAKQKPIDIPLPEGKSLFLREEGKEPGQMNFGELRRYISDVKALGFDTSRFEVDLSSKISFPFVALIMTLLGIPFAFSMGKRGALVGIGVSLAISIVYWVAIGVFRSLGYISVLNTFLAAWGPNLIFGLVGLYLLLRLRT